MLNYFGKSLDHQSPSASEIRQGRQNELVDSGPRNGDSGSRCCLCSTDQSLLRPEAIETTSNTKLSELKSAVEFRAKEEEQREAIRVRLAELNPLFVERQIFENDPDSYPRS